MPKALRWGTREQVRAAWCFKGRPFQSVALFVQGRWYRIWHLSWNSYGIKATKEVRLKVPIVMPKALRQGSRRIRASVVWGKALPLGTYYSTIGSFLVWMSCLPLVPVWITFLNLAKKANSIWRSTEKEQSLPNIKKKLRKILIRRKVENMMLMPNGINWGTVP